MSSTLEDVREAAGDGAAGDGHAGFTDMAKSTRADWEIIGAHFKQLAAGLPDRVLGELGKLAGDYGGMRIDRLQHSLQTATRAHRDGRDEEYVVCALLHDIGELLCPNAHGELPASLLRPYVSPKSWWVLAHHEIFQGYYYLDKCGGDKHARERFRYHKYFGACEEFCYKYDQAAFDPEYELPDLDEVFAPMVRRVLAREPYWHLGHLDTPTCEAKDAIAQGYE